MALVIKENIGFKAFLADYVALAVFATFGTRNALFRVHKVLFRLTSVAVCRVLAPLAATLTRITDLRCFRRNVDIVEVCAYQTVTICITLQAFRIVFGRAVVAGDAGG